MKYLITSASGHLGQHVVKQIQSKVPETSLRLGIHTMAKQKLFAGTNCQFTHIDFQDTKSVDQAVNGVDVVIYIPSITYNLRQRLNEFENILAAAQKYQVQSFIFVGFFADQEDNPFTMSGFYGYVPRRLAGSGLHYSVVKNALYADPLVPYLPELIQRHNVIYPVGNQPLSFISREDSAKAIASLATQPAMRDHGQVYYLTMEQNYNMVELSSIMTQVSGHHIGYSPVSLKQFASIYAAEGDGSELASMYAGGAKGLLSTVSHDFHRLTGQRPMTMTQFLTANYHN